MILLTAGERSALLYLELSAQAYEQRFDDSPETAADDALRDLSDGGLRAKEIERSVASFCAQRFRARA